MKYLLIICLSLGSYLAFAQSQAEVLTAVERMRQAMLAEDAETLAELTSKDLSYGHSAGTIENQEQFLAEFASKNVDYQRWDMSGLEVRFYGKELAIVRHEVIGEILSNGNLNTLNLGLMMVWVIEDGKWKLLARQSFRKP